MKIVNEIIFIFVIYSFIGWILESTYKSILEKKIINSGFLIGPFCPIYGWGCIIIYYALIGLKDNIALLFVAGFVVLSIWEYIVGWFLEIVFKTKYWDYSSKHFNINGRVCLLNSTFWGVLGILFILLVHPFICKIINMIPDMFTITFLYVSMAYIIIDTIITTTNIIKVNIKIEKVQEIENDIKRRMKIINDLRKHNEIMIKRKIETKFSRIGDKMITRVDSLEEGKEMITKLIENKMKRLRRAFPNMKSDRLFKVLDENKFKDIK